MGEKGKLAISTASVNGIGRVFIEDTGGGIRKII